MCRVSQPKVSENAQLGVALVIFVMLFALPIWAQDPLSLKEAVKSALEKNRSIEASSAAQQAAESRIQEARGGFLPKVNYSESWSRSDNPVFVFRPYVPLWLRSCSP